MGLSNYWACLGCMCKAGGVIHASFLAFLDFFPCYLPPLIVEVQCYSQCQSTQQQEQHHAKETQSKASFADLPLGSGAFTGAPLLTSLYFISSFRIRGLLRTGTTEESLLQLAITPRDHLFIIHFSVLIERITTDWREIFKLSLATTIQNTLNK